MTDSSDLSHESPSQSHDWCEREDDKCEEPAVDEGHYQRDHEGRQEVNQHPQLLAQTLLKFVQIPQK